MGSSIADEVDLASLMWIQGRLRYMLRQLVTVATAADAPYYVSYGTLLGAVRDADLIDWDWDADVLVPIEVYDKLLDRLTRDLPPDLTVHVPGEAGYEYLFARISVAGLGHPVAHVDLFPLCGAPTWRGAQRLDYLINRCISIAYVLKLVRLSNRPQYRPLKRLCAYALRLVPLAFVRASWLERLFRTRIYRRPAFRGRSSTDLRQGIVTNPCGSYGSAEYFRASWFRETLWFPIGGLPNPAPNGYGALLAQVYGNYQQRPDEDVRMAALREAERCVLGDVRRFRGLTE